MDEHDVTNAEFSKFVEAIWYVSTAERKIDWEDLDEEVPPSARRRPAPVRPIRVTRALFSETTPKLPARF